MSHQQAPQVKLHVYEAAAPVAVILRQRPLRQVGMRYCRQRDGSFTDMMFTPMRAPHDWRRGADR